MSAINKSTTTVETITPQKAERYMGFNTANRPIRVARIREYAEAISRGEWKLNGEAIKFAEDGGLLDGQHRLLAIIEADTPVTTFVMRGLGTDVFDTMDRGLSRTNGQMLSIKGEANHSQLAATLAIARAIEENPENPDFRARISPQQQVAYLEANPTIREWVQLSHSLVGMNSRAQVAAVLFLAAKKDESQARMFMDRLSDGARLTKHHPIMTLRDMMIRDKASTAKIPKDTLVAMIIKAWNTMRDGRVMRVARFVADKEAYPVIK